MTTLHQIRTHPRYVPSCFGCKAGTLRFNGAPDVKGVDLRERVLTQDLAAYKALREQGLQPQHVGGSAHLQATARNALEIEHPSLAKLPDEARKLAPEAAQVAVGIAEGMSRFTQ